MSASPTTKTDIADPNAPASPPNITYAFEGAGVVAGKIIRTDATDTIHVATYDNTTKTLYLVKEWMKFRGPAVRWLGEQGIPIASTVFEGDRPDPVRSDIPPEPLKHPEMGDKTPAWVSWLAKWHPARFKAEFGVTGKCQVTGKWIANRKCHLTILNADAATTSPGTSWNASTAIPEGEEGAE